MKQVAVFGGTFDPVHNGHLRSAQELFRQLDPDELYMLPCRLPPHRDFPGASSQQRLDMLRLACDATALKVDDREMRRTGPSYSVDTLRELRAEQGDKVSLVWVMGADAFCALDTWHEWQSLPQLAHIVVMARPGEQLPDKGEVATLLHQRRTDNLQVLKQASSGSIVPVSLTPYPIAASDIRARVKKGLAVDELIPAPVVDYIHTHQLYRSQEH